MPGWSGPPLAELAAFCPPLAELAAFCPPLDELAAFCPPLDELARACCRPWKIREPAVQTPFMSCWACMAYCTESQTDCRSAVKYWNHNCKSSSSGGPSG